MAKVPAKELKRRAALSFEHPHVVPKFFDYPENTVDIDGVAHMNVCLTCKVPGCRKHIVNLYRKP